MGCGSSVGQVSNSINQSHFKPLKLLQLQKDHSLTCASAKIFIFGQTKTQRRVFQIKLGEPKLQPISTRTRIPIPKVQQDPLEMMYQQSQQIFHLGLTGMSILPPFNHMLIIYMHQNVLFMCGGVDYDSYNIKSQTYFYNAQIQQKNTKSSQQQMTSPSHLESQRTSSRSKNLCKKFQKLSNMNRSRYGHTGLYNSKNKSIYIFGGTNEKEQHISSCQRYGVMQNSWKEIESMHTNRAFASCFLFLGKIYVFGGRANSLKLSKKIQVYDSETNHWDILPFKLHRGIQKAFIFSPRANQLLIVGGTTHSGPTESVVKINLKNQSYIWDSDLNHAHQHAKGVAQNDVAFIFGGQDNKLQKYQKEKWKIQPFEHKNYITSKQLETFSFSRQSVVISGSNQTLEQQHRAVPQSVFFGNDKYPCILQINKTKEISISMVPMSVKLKSQMGIIQYQLAKYFLCGGCDVSGKKSSRSCYFYESQTRQGRQTITMPQKKQSFAICSHNDHIYIFGGYCGENQAASKTCSRFNLKQQQWQEISNLEYSRRNAKAQLVDFNKILVFGGDNNQEPVGGIQIYYISYNRFQIFDPKFQIPQIIASYSSKIDHNIYIFQKKNQQVEMTKYDWQHFEQKILDQNPKMVHKESLQLVKEKRKQVKSDQLQIQLPKINQEEHILQQKNSNNTQKQLKSKIQSENVVKENKKGDQLFVKYVKQSEKADKISQQSSTSVPFETNTRVIHIQPKVKQDNFEKNQQNRSLNKKQQQQIKFQSQFFSKKNVKQSKAEDQNINQIKGAKNISSEVEDNIQEINFERIQAPNNQSILNINNLFNKNQKEQQQAQDQSIKPKQQTANNKQKKNQNNHLQAQHISKQQNKQSLLVIQKKFISVQKIDWLKTSARSFRRYNKIYFFSQNQGIELDTQTNIVQKFVFIPNKLISRTLTDNS